MYQKMFYSKTSTYLWWRHSLLTIKCNIFVHLSASWKKYRWGETFVLCMKHLQLKRWFIVIHLILPITHNANLLTPFLRTDAKLLRSFKNWKALSMAEKQFKKNIYFLFPTLTWTLVEKDTTREVQCIDELLHYTFSALTGSLKKKKPFWWEKTQTHTRTNHPHTCNLIHQSTSIVCAEIPFFLGGGRGSARLKPFVTHDFLRTHVSMLVAPVFGKRNSVLQHYTGGTGAVITRAP